MVRSVTGEDVDMERLGVAEVHGRRSGVVHIVTESEEDALERARALTELLGNQGKIGDTEIVDIDLESLLPEGAKRAYDVHPLINGVLDPPGVELHAKWAPNIVTALGRLGGRTVGVVANNPLRLGGCLDATSAEKAARFVRIATRSACRWSSWLTFPATCQVSDKSGTAWCGAVRNSCTRSPKQPCRE